jgi:methylenetetrahydrofolate dehydrogenase (NADP+)/methenyltetrahydrofolate cyclohydrolase
VATILSAKNIVNDIVLELKKDCETLKQTGIVPKLKVFLIGNHAPSVIYTRNKKKFIEKFGAECDIITLPESTTEEAFLNQVREAAESKDVNGLFVQLPLPKHLKHIDVGQIVPSQKDVDGFHAHNLYKLLKGENTGLVSCTPKGIITLLEKNNIEISGKNAVVIGRSMIVGKPMGMLLTNKSATVTLCHSKTSNLKEITRKADIIISAIGQPNFFDKSYLTDNQNVTIIDVGINHDESGTLCGDIDFQSVEAHCSAISPVPGGVGPLTIASLGQNLVLATQLQNS